MQFEVDIIQQEPFVEQNSIISPLENQLTSMQLLTIVSSIIIGCLLGGINGVALILSPLYINKSSYAIIIVFLILIMTGQFTIEQMILKSMIGLNMGHIFGNLLKRKDEARYLMVSQKIININIPIFI